MQLFWSEMAAGVVQSLSVRAFVKHLHGSVEENKLAADVWASLRAQGTGL